MASSIEERIERLLDQLEHPSLTAQEIELIKQKIEVLRNTQQ